MGFGRIRGFSSGIRGVGPRSGLHGGRFDKGYTKGFVRGASLRSGAFVKGANARVRYRRAKMNIRPSKAYKAGFTTGFSAGSRSSAKLGKKMLDFAAGGSMTRSSARGYRAGMNTRSALRASPWVLASGGLVVLHKKQKNRPLSAKQVRQRRNAARKKRK